MKSHACESSPGIGEESTFPHLSPNQIAGWGPWDFHIKLLMQRRIPRAIVLEPACACAQSLSGPTPCDPMDCSSPGSSVYGIFQARILEWFAVSSSSLTQGSNQVSCIGRRILYHLSHHMDRWILTLWCLEFAPSSYLCNFTFNDTCYGRFDCRMED